MGTLSLRELGLQAQGPLFQNLTFTVGGQDRLGLIAGNGGGKTTLLRCMAGLIEPWQGDITRSRGLRVAMVEQDVPEKLLELPLAEAVRRALAPEVREDEGWRVGLVLDEFETPEDLRERPLKALSGGWQRLALLARIWVTEPDLLLLDEPTNHLDLAKIQLLENWITGPAAQVPMVIASHDRRFLDNCTTRTLFLRPTLSRSYPHPYTEARRLLAEDEVAEAAKLAKDSREVERMRQSARELKNIGVNSGSDYLQKRSAQMKARAEALEETLRPLHQERSGVIKLANRGTHAKVLLKFDEVTVRAPDQRALFKIPKLTVQQGERLVLLGRNGVGKSQFVQLIRRALETPDSEAGIKASPTLVLGYVDQQMSHLPGKVTPQDFINERFRLGDQRSLSLLAGAGFPLLQQQLPIERLSPGQKARLGLLALRLTDPNFYLLDEPTNHVDIAGQERLEQEIIEHEATTLLVSHDRSFVRAIGTRFLLIEGGKLKEIDDPEIFHRSL